MTPYVDILAFGLFGLNISVFICTVGFIIGYVHTLPLQLAGIMAMALAPRLFRS